MQINGPSIPFNIARAYGVKPTAAPKPTAAVAAPTKITPPNVAAKSDAVSQLVGGRTGQPMDFSQGTTALKSSAQTLPLYTRAADRIEAATGVQLGRALDIRG